MMTVMGFALIWHIWWLALVGFIGSIAYGIYHTFDYDRDFYLQPDEVRAIANGRRPVVPAE